MFCISTSLEETMDKPTNWITQAFHCPKAQLFTMDKVKVSSLSPNTPMNISMDNAKVSITKGRSPLPSTLISTLLIVQTSGISAHMWPPLPIGLNSSPTHLMRASSALEARTSTMDCSIKFDFPLLSPHSH